MNFLFFTTHVKNRGLFRSPYIIIWKIIHFMLGLHILYYISLIFVDH